MICTELPTMLCYPARTNDLLTGTGCPIEVPRVEPKLNPSLSTATTIHGHRRVSRTAVGTRYYLNLIYSYLFTSKCLLFVFFVVLICGGTDW